MSETLSITPETDTPVEQRLQESAAECLSSLSKWKANLKDDDAKQALLGSVHELRKVCARIEVDVAMNDRTNTNSKHIPIPEHKSKTEHRKDQKPLSEILPVAEIKRANAALKKIAIENANSDDDDDMDDDHDNSQQPMTNELNDAAPSKPRRPRRKKKDDN